MVQKEGLRLPIYDTNKSGERHCLTSIATVEIEGEYFAGEVAKTKKQEEINAAKVAYKALMECKCVSFNSNPLIPVQLVDYFFCVCVSLCNFCMYIIKFNFSFFFLKNCMFFVWIK